MNETLKISISNQFSNTPMGFIRIKNNLNISNLSDNETEIYLKKIILSTPIEEIETKGKNYYFKSFKHNAILTINSHTLTIITAKQINKKKKVRTDAIFTPMPIENETRNEFMILEVAILEIKKGQEENFEITFKEAQKIISSIKGYISHSLQKCIENNHKYLLTVSWETLEDHTIGFRKSKEYLEWKNLLHHFYEPFPTVEQSISKAYFPIILSGR